MIKALAETGEWVWFPGADRVQGFTNPLWTLYMALLHMLGLEGSSAVLGVSLMGIALIIGTSILAAIFVRLVLAHTRYEFIASMASAGTIPFLYPTAFWTLRGMEVGLLGFLAILMVLSVILTMDRSGKCQFTNRPLILFMLAAVLGILTRLDFSALACVLVTWCFLWAPDRLSRMYVFLMMALLILTSVAIVLAFQYFYWGDWLPNTYRLKVEGFTAHARLDKGLRVLAKTLPFMSLVALATFVALLKGTKTACRAVTLLGGVILVCCLYSAWVGGDAWEWSGMINRYVAVVLPAGVIAVFVGLGGSWINCVR